MMKGLTRAVLVAVIAIPVCAGEFEVPFEVHGTQNAILVEVVLNGKSRTFLVDTGASRTIVSREAVGVMQFDLKLAAFHGNGPGMGGQGLWMKVPSLRLGERRWHDRRVVVMDLSRLAKVYGRTIDGLLGQDILREFERVEIDFKQRRLRLSR